MTDGVRQFQVYGKQIEFQKNKKSVQRDLYEKDSDSASIFDKLNKADKNGAIDNILDENELNEFEKKNN